MSDERRRFLRGRKEALKGLCEWERLAVLASENARDLRDLLRAPLREVALSYIRTVTDI